VVRAQEVGEAAACNCTARWADPLGLYATPQARAARCCAVHVCIQIGIVQTGIAAIANRIAPVCGARLSQCLIPVGPMCWKSRPLRLALRAAQGLLARAGPVHARENPGPLMGV
jgi:hypothetical protein